MLKERENATPDTADKGGRTPPPPAKECRPVGAVGILPGQSTISQDSVMTDLTDQAVLTQTSQMRYGGAVKRRLVDQGSVPQSVGSSSSTDLLPAGSSEPSSALPKGSGGLDIHDKSSSFDEPSHPQYYPVLLAFLDILLYLILAILLPISVYYIFSSFYLQNCIA